MTNQNNELDDILLDLVLLTQTDEYQGEREVRIRNAKQQIQALYAPKPVENGELRELLKGEMFAAIEYGRLNSDVTQDAVEASWFHHLDDIMEYVDDHVAQEKAKWVAEAERTVIGEDEPAEFGKSHRPSDVIGLDRAIERNKLRADQRQALAKLLDKENV